MTDTKIRMHTTADTTAADAHKAGTYYAYPRRRQGQVDDSKSSPGRQHPISCIIARQVQHHIEFRGPDKSGRAPVGQEIAPQAEQLLTWTPAATEVE